MPAPELSHRYQPAILFPYEGNSDGYGQPLMGTPVPLRVRWSDTQSDQLDPQGRRVRVDATVRVDREITIGSEMWLGEWNDWIGTALGQTDDTKVMVVKTYNAEPDVRNRYIDRVVGLMKKGATRNPSQE